MSTMANHITEFQKSEVINWKKAGKSIKEIGAITGISKTTVARSIQSWFHSESVSRKIGSGKPEKLSILEKKFFKN